MSNLDIRGVVAVLGSGYYDFCHRRYLDDTGLHTLMLLLVDSDMDLLTFVMLSRLCH
jgi:hypothetical protein